MRSMANYLLTMDKLKAKYIDMQKLKNEDSYPFSQYYYYEQVSFTAEEGVQFKQWLFAVKLAKTTILFVDKQTGTKVYLSDFDIANMIKRIGDKALKTHIISSIQKVINGKKLDTLVFAIQKKTFKVKGIAFDIRFNDIICENPADININGNDFIALINLILEKERTDTNPNKLTNTAKLYIGLKNT